MGEASVSPSLFVILRVPQQTSTTRTGQIVQGIVVHGGPIDSRIQQAQARDPLEKVFKVSLFGPNSVLQPAYRELGQCWTSLFTESVLAYGFPVCSTIRPDEMLGLEIPFRDHDSIRRRQIPRSVGRADRFRKRVKSARTCGYFW